MKGIYMNINISIIKHQLKLRKNKPLSTEPIGSRFKFERRRLNLTLDEAADQICSVSYLSKVENNLLKPSEEVFEKLMIRYQIDKIKGSAQKYQSSLVEISRAFFFGETIIKPYKVTTCYQEMLINLGILSYLLNYEKALLQFEEISPFIKNFTDTELALFLYFTTILLTGQGRQSEAFALLVGAKSLASDDILLDSMIKKELLLLAFYINDYIYIENNYHHNLEYFIKYGFHQAIEEIRFNYYLFISRFKAKETILEELIKNYHPTTKEYKTVKAAINYRQKEYNNAHQFLQDLEHDERFYQITLLKLKTLDRKQDVDSIKNLIKGLKVKNSDLHKMIEYLKLKYNQNDKAQLEYLRKEVIDCKYITQNPLVLDYWYEEVTKVLKRSAFYKELVSFLQRVIQAQQQYIN